MFSDTESQNLVFGVCCEHLQAKYSSGMCMLQFRRALLRNSRHVIDIEVIVRLRLPGSVAQAMPIQIVHVIVAHWPITYYFLITH